MDGIFDKRRCQRCAVRIGYGTANRHGDKLLCLVCKRSEERSSSLDGMASVLAKAWGAVVL